MKSPDLKTLIDERREALRLSAESERAQQTIFEIIDEHRQPKLFNLAKHGRETISKNQN